MISFGLGQVRLYGIEKTVGLLSKVEVWYILVGNVWFGASFPSKYWGVMEDHIIGKVNGTVR